MTARLIINHLSFPPYLNQQLIRGRSTPYAATEQWRCELVLAFAIFAVALVAVEARRSPGPDSSDLPT